MLEGVRGIPGVQSSAFTVYLPLSGTNNSWAFNIEGRPAKPPGVYDTSDYRPVTAGYFETIGTVHRGRGFDARDNEDGRSTTTSVAKPAITSVLRPLFARAAVVFSSVNGLPETRSRRGASGSS
jgi:hypothetical protein